MEPHWLSQLEWGHVTHSHWLVTPAIETSRAHYLGSLLFWLFWLNTPSYSQYYELAAAPTTGDNPGSKNTPPHIPCTALETAQPLVPEEVWSTLSRWSPVLPVQKANNKYTPQSTNEPLLSHTLNEISHTLIL